MRGRKGCEDNPYPQADYLVELNRKLLDMNIDEIRQRGLDGKAMGRAIRDARLKLIEAEKRSGL